MSRRRWNDVIIQELGVLNVRRDVVVRFEIDTVLKTITIRITTSRSRRGRRGRLLRYFHNRMDVEHDMKDVTCVFG